MRLAVSGKPTSPFSNVPLYKCVTRQIYRLKTHNSEHIIQKNQRNLRPVVLTIVGIELIKHQKLYFENVFKLNTCFIFECEKKL